MFSVLKDGVFSDVVYVSLTPSVIDKHKCCEIAQIISISMIGCVASIDDINSGISATRKCLYESISDPIKSELDYEKEIDPLKADDLRLKWLASVSKIKDENPFRQILK